MSNRRAGYGRYDAEYEYDAEVDVNEAMDALEARVHRQLNRMRDLADHMAAIRVRETSPDGMVTAEVDGNGALCDLVFSTAISTLSPSEFETVVVATAGRAAHLAIARRGDLVTAFNQEMAESMPGVQDHRIP